MLKKLSSALVLVLVMGIALTGCAPTRQAPAQDDDSNEDAVSGEPEVISSVDGKDVINMVVDGKTREFIVYRPTDIEEDSEVPVVFMFHGSGGTGEKYFEEETGWKLKAEEEGFMTVFPTGLKYHVFDEEKVVQGEVRQDVAAYQTKWNGYGLSDSLDPAYPDQTLADDVKFTREMVDYVNEEYAADSNRFYATGFSNGSQFTARLAVEMTDVFAAYAGVGAGPGYGKAQEQGVVDEETRENFEPRSFISVFGSEDAKITHAAGVESFPLDESAIEEEAYLRMAVVNQFLALLKLEDDYDYEKTERAAIFTFDENIDEEASHEYTLMIAEGMGHIYPNGKNYPVDATDVFWPFFEENVLN
ncbi:MAG: hypothetical protein AAB802_02515 [Patescibacteria group bacterium]